MIPNALSDFRLRLTTVLVVAAASTALARQESPAEPTTVTIRGQELTIWPVDDLRSRGIEIEEVPRAENAAWLYLDAANTYIEVPEETAEAFDYACSKAWPAGQPALEAYMAREETRKAIDLTVRASAMDKCQIPYFGKPTDSIIAVLLPSMAHMRFLAKLLVADGRRLESEGRFDDAAARHFACMRMGIHAAEGFTLIETLVGVAIWQLGDRAAIDLALRNDLNERQLRRLAADFAKLNPRVPAADRGLQGEQRFGPAIVDEIISRPLRAFTNLGGVMSLASYSGGPGWNGEPDLNINPQDGWSRLEKRLGEVLFPDQAIKKHMHDFYEMQRILATRPMSTEARSFDEEKYFLERIPRWDVISRTMLPSLSRAIHIGLTCRARAALSEGIVAVRRYQLAHENAAPAALTDLKDLVPPGSLVDPFTGEPLLYRQDAAGWVLYSVGPNMKDDGGVESDTQRWDQFDVAHGFPAPTLEPMEPAAPDKN